MNINHDIFTLALKENRKIILTYYSDTEKHNLTKELVPVYYRHSDSECSTDIYYFWDSNTKGNHILILYSPKIKLMKMSNEGFAKT